MPPLSWVAAASLLAAAIGAAIARAVGRAYRASGRLPIGARVAPLPEGGAPPDRSAPVPHVAELSGPCHPPDAETPRLAARLRRTADAWSSSPGRSGLSSRLRRIPPETGLALAAAVLYVITRLWSIDSFPLYFYSDEFNSVWFGEQALQNGLLGEDGSWPALYFPWDDNRREPGAAVYLYGLTALLFGKSIWVARATGALISLCGVLAVAWMLKESFRSRFWWASILMAASIPCWFLYSRNAYAPLAGVGFYAIFLLAYARYRLQSPGALGWAAVAGAAAFYSYGNMHLAMVGLSACLLASDFRYHLQQRLTWLRTVPILALLSVPLLQYRILHPEAIRASLTALGSFWVQDLPLTAKLLRYVQNYLVGLSPFYWFAPEKGTGILPVQYIPGAGHLGLVLLPLVAIGLYVCLRNLRSPLHRLILFSALVVPAGSAMDTIEIIRVLAMVVPALLLSVLGLQQLGDWLHVVSRPVQTAVVAVLFLALGITRTVDALVHGPTWTTDYGLLGAQFGAKAVFEEAVPELLAQHPGSTIVMTTTWANNVHQFPRFFLSPADKERIRFSNVRDYLDRILPLDPEAIIVMTPEEYADAVASPMLGELDVVRIVYLPNGEPGFYFAHLAYAADVEQVLQEQEALRVQLTEAQVDILGQPTLVRHSRLGDGQIANLFDGTPQTLVRSDQVNPFQVEIQFAEPQRLNGVRVTVGSFADFSVTLALMLAGVEEPLVISERYHDLAADPTVSVDLPSAGSMVSSLRLEVSDNSQGPFAMIHVREITLY